MTEVCYGGSLEHIKELLRTYTLEKFSEIVLKPTWINKEFAEKYKGCSEIIGNFVEYSNAFKIITDDKALIKLFKVLFSLNAWNKV